jgi:glycosyltransferase involved in cell wall biosynthesis
MTAQRVIALLGRRDEPTDAVEEYCRHLGAALAAHDFQLDIRRVPWNQHGWGASLDALRLQAESWQGVWILVQYTALAWSARGFPGRILRVLRILRKSGARIAIVFHDVEPFAGARLIDRFRRRVQLGVMRDAAAFSDGNITTIATYNVSWMSGCANECVFIPVGANLTISLDPATHGKLHSPPAIGVFSITGGAAGDRETRDVIAAVRRASEKLGKLRLLVFGRYAEIREPALREGFRGSQLDLVVEGVVEEADLFERFADCDVLLFVRGAISSRRSSAIAGIACGLPLVALSGSETASPVTEAGVILLPSELEESALQAQLGESLVEVLSDEKLHAELAARSRSAQENFFSWSVIARQFVDFLNRRE